MPGLLIYVFVLLIVVACWFAWQAEKQRRAKFREWAEARGFTYSHEHDPAVRKVYGFLDRLQIGHSRRGYHLLRGEWEGRTAAAFQFRYTVGSGKHQHTYHVAVALLHLERSFPEFLLGPESVLHRFAGIFGYDDIDFESAEFSQAFNVRCQDKKFAYDFCHAGMMEYLLAHRATCLEQENGVLALLVDGTLEAGKLDGMFGTLGEVRALMPDYLFRG
ncbi:MAG: hypothetical protein O3A20_07660 [Planctomycetota bacterium]|nr:hypothetical protein [Planctomycetota bacterium]